MKKISAIALLLVLLFSLTGFTSPVTASQVQPQFRHRTYTVSVGAENARAGIAIESFFPSTLRIHVGDSVIWSVRSHEIHTVTFLGTEAMPDLLIPAPQGAASPLMFNPKVAFPAVPANDSYDGTGYVNSGLLSLDPGQTRYFRLTFTKAGTYTYVCVVHGMMMSGKVEVLGTNTAIPTPHQVNLQAGRQATLAMRNQVPAALTAARAAIKAPVKNADGTTTFYIETGYAAGAVDLMRFFPHIVNVHPGDTIVWELSPSNMAPHTVTFANGNPEPQMVVPVPQPSGPPLLLLNKEVLMPSANVIAKAELNNKDFFNSGLLAPAPQGPTSFSIKVGNVTGAIPYYCILHDASGMQGWVVVTPRTTAP